jgi:hypothetical protein
MKTANSSSAENIFWVEFLRYQNLSSSKHKKPLDKKKDRKSIAVNGSLNPI